MSCIKTHKIDFAKKSQCSLSNHKSLIIVWLLPLKATLTGFENMGNEAKVTAIYFGTFYFFMVYNSSTHLGQKFQIIKWKVNFSNELL